MKDHIAAATNFVGGNILDRASVALAFEAIMWKNDEPIDHYHDGHDDYHDSITWMNDE
jgi:hypothetical protein